PALLVAGAANAAEIYNKNGNKLDLYGKVDGLRYFSDNAGDDGFIAYKQKLINLPSIGALYHAQPPRARKGSMSGYSVLKATAIF
ncbi:hypothetical protein ONQ62_27955, partial [Salmonella enterica subsp. enterica serovar Virginia]|nr:hypothetical protein [Salmonella enterica subsp. enterica serovar Virginia]